MPITSITIQNTRDGRPENICWCGYPKSVCRHGPEVKSRRSKSVQKPGELILGGHGIAYRIPEEVLL